MHLIYHHPTQAWSVGLSYSFSATTGYLEQFLKNPHHMIAEDFVLWCHNHNVQGYAFCDGGFLKKLRSRKFVRQFNKGMQMYGILIQPEELKERASS